MATFYYKGTLVLQELKEVTENSLETLSNVSGTNVTENIDAYTTEFVGLGELVCYDGSIYVGACNDVLTYEETGAGGTTVTKSVYGLKYLGGAGE